MQRIVFAAFAMALSVLFLTVTPAVQGQSDFSGVWQMDQSRSESAHQAVPIGPVTLLIKQSPEEISIETRKGESNHQAASTETLTYKLDGSESTLSGTSGGPIKVKAHWEGSKLVTETSRNVQDSTVTLVYVLSLQEGGREMTIQKTLTVQHGYQFQGAAASGTGKDVFTKVRR